MDLQAANTYLYQRLLDPSPFMAGKLGSVEFSCLLSYLNQTSSKNKSFKKGIRDQMKLNAGVFSNSNQQLTQFCDIVQEALSYIDVICTWEKKEEPFVFHHCCPTASIIPMPTFDAYRFEKPWTAALAGKRVLVIHPFTVTISNQYQHHNLIFKNPLTLPHFTLLTLKAVQTIANTPTHYKTWSEALKSMCDAMEKIEWDIVLIGAGAYGLPLAAHAKKMGKKAVHMGGNLQILFGIKGKRWEDDQQIQTIYNDYWVRPLPEETPEKFLKIESGAYW